MYRFLVCSVERKGDYVKEKLGRGRKRCGLFEDCSNIYLEELRETINNLNKDSHSSDRDSNGTS
jgi:hypothetical protein